MSMLTLLVAAAVLVGGWVAFAHKYPNQSGQVKSTVSHVVDWVKALFKKIKG